MAPLTVKRGKRYCSKREVNMGGVAMQSGTELIIQRGALGLLAVVVIGLGFFAWRLLAIFSKATQAVVASVDEAAKRVSAATEKLQIDFAEHVEADSHEQRTIAERLDALTKQIDREHELIAIALDETIGNVRQKAGG